VGRTAGCNPFGTEKKDEDMNGNSRHGKKSNTKKTATRKGGLAFLTGFPKPCGKCVVNSEDGTWDLPKTLLEGTSIVEILKFIPFTWKGKRLSQKSLTRTETTKSGGEYA